VSASTRCGRRSYLISVARAAGSLRAAGHDGLWLPAAIGAQFANPGRLVIDIDGDASIRMNLVNSKRSRLRSAGQDRGAE